MTACWIDTDGALEATRRWDRLGEILHDTSGDGVAVQRLVASARALWSASDLVHRALDELAGGDAAITHGAWSVASGRSPLSGDRGGAGTAEVRPPYSPSRHGDAVDRGREVVVRALTDTGDASRIRPDEFGLVRVAADRYVVVLPGVVDLSHPHLGWDPRHRSVRDLDRAALSSARTPGVEANPYALTVRASLRSAGVPTGAELLVVGHSFGADTALDLASDERFNGPTGYRVTHVVAAGYHAGRHLGSGSAPIPDGTEVLVLQSRTDVAVVAEAVGLPLLAGADDAADSLADLLRLDLRGWAANQADAAARPFEAAGSLADLVVGGSTFDSPPGVVVSTFDGDRTGWGHDQDNYVRHLVGSEDPSVVGFLASVARAGYAERGEAVALDVSVPTNSHTDVDADPGLDPGVDNTSQKT